MSLRDRLASAVNADVAPPVVAAPGQSDTDIQHFTVDFFLEHQRVRADLDSPERRLSDHLNGSTTVLEIRPATATQTSSGAAVDLSSAAGYLTKTRLLFVVPVVEPQHARAPESTFWKVTVSTRCWASIGPYRISGTIHTESGRDVYLAIRSLDKQFIPLTDATITYPDGSTAIEPAVLVNRPRLELLALHPAPQSQ